MSDTTMEGQKKMYNILDWWYS